MPAGPKGEKRPADVIGNAVKVIRMEPSAVDRPHDRGADGDGDNTGGSGPSIVLPLGLRRRHGRELVGGFEWDAAAILEAVH